jgi:hypothetical protein
MRVRMSHGVAESELLREDTLCRAFLLNGCGHKTACSRLRLPGANHACRGGEKIATRPEKNLPPDKDGGAFNYKRYCA